MPVILTSHGNVAVHNWGYMLQGLNGAPLSPTQVGNAAHDLMVIDFSRDGTGATEFSPAEVRAMANGPGGEKVLISYISIGEADEFRDLWDPAWTTNGRASGQLTPAAPSWLGPTNPDWPESRKVRYWDTDWQDLIFNDAGTGWLDQIVQNGFDAAYLDIVDAYFYWAVEAPNSVREPGDPARNDEKDAAQRMIDFIVDMVAHARETNPRFFAILQNGDFIIDALENTDPARKAALLSSIGGIAVEDVYFGGDRDENNAFNPDEDRIAVLQRDFLANGKFVLAVDYVNQAAKTMQFIEAAVGDGFYPYVAPDRDLDRLSAPRGTGLATAAADIWLGNPGGDTFAGRGGNDVLNGMRGNDTVSGEAGNDALFGFVGDDRLNGSAGIDKLDGGTGSDTLFGGAQADSFIFAKGNRLDSVRDFQNGVDTLHLDGLGPNFADVRAHTVQVAGHIEITYGPDKLVVFGLTLAGFDSSDVAFI